MKDRRRTARCGRQPIASGPVSAMKSGGSRTNFAQGETGHGSFTLRRQRGELSSDPRRLGGFLERGLKHFQETGVDPETIVEARLAPDMLPLRFQIISVAQHSRGAIEGVQSGEFRPPSFKTPYDYAGLQGLVAQTREALAAWTPEAVNALGGRDVVFNLGEHKLPFTAEGFLMSFSLPNFYFHATTAYDILRTNGVPLGKRDFMGRLKMKK